ncbi:hypothetical protein L218DRAFT_413660 [Marasmius fiardii PR-910]|nr:hypothetical protein L218DRAFT_413660 [Marasmius fiardii PR-910]
MHLTSTNRSHPPPSQDVPVIVVRHGLKRKFLSRMDSYDDMRRIVRRKFNIDETTEVSFEVNHFDVCENERVEVDETAYPAMSPYIYELYLNITTTPEPASSSGSDVKGKGRELYPMPAPNASEDSVARDEDDDQHVQQILQPPNRVLSPKLSPSPKARVELVSAANAYPKGDDEDEDDDKQDEAGPSETKRSPPPSLPSPTRNTFMKLKGKAPSVTPITSTPRPASRSKTNSVERSPAAAPSGGGNHKANELFNDSVIVEEDVVIADSPAEREPESEPEPEPEQAPEHEPEPQGFAFGRQYFGESQNDQGQKEGKRQKQTQPPPHEVIDVDLDRPPRYEEAHAGPSSLVTPTEDDDRKPISKSKRAGPSRSVNLDDDDGAQNRGISSKPRFKKATSATVTRQNSLRDYDEAEPPAATQGPVVHKPSAEDQENNNDLVQPDGRFKIYISGPKPDHRAEFMTKSRHVLRKVLLGACKTFKLDPKRARLEQLVVLTEDDGDRELYFPCDNGDTVGKAGLQPGAELRVVVDDDLGDDD